MDNGIIFDEVKEQQRYLGLSEDGQIGWISKVREHPQEVLEIKDQRLKMNAHRNVVRYDRG